MNDDEWFENIMEQHRKEKAKSKVEMNPGWANPFGNASKLPKNLPIQKTGKTTIQSTAKSNINERYKSPPITKTSNKISAEGTNVKSSIHETDEFIIDNCNKPKQKVLNEMSVRKNINGLEDLLESNISDTGTGLRKPVKFGKAK